jgi:hypothetical protein
MAAFEYRQAREVGDALARHGVRYLFIGKAGAILLGFADTTQDVDLFVQRSAENGRALVETLNEFDPRRPVRRASSPSPSSAKDVRPTPAPPTPGWTTPSRRRRA